MMNASRIALVEEVAARHDGSRFWMSLASNALIIADRAGYLDGCNLVVRRSPGSLPETMGQMTADRLEKLADLLRIHGSGHWCPVRTALWDACHAYRASTH